MLIKRKIENDDYSFELTKDEVEEVSRLIREKKEKTLAEAIRELPSGGTVEVRFDDGK